MKRVLFSFLLSCLLSVWGAPAWAAGAAQLQYRLAPGQVWIGTFSSQSQTSFMGEKSLHRSKSVIEYRVKKGTKANWFSLTARIVKQHTPGQEGGGQMDLSGIAFMADMHRSGELRNIRHEGTALPAGMSELPPQMKQMYAQSSDMIADAWKSAVFWFPELPEAPMRPGDEFDVTRRIGMGGAGAGIQAQTVSKQVFTLEEVSKGLAYFTVRERSVTKMKGMAGGRSDTKTAAKGETVFDTKTGMWLDMVVKSRSKVGMSGIAGMGDTNQEAVNVSKYEMTRKK